MFGLKPYRSVDAGEIFPQFPPILDVMCYKNSKNVDKMIPAYQALTKCLGKPVESVSPKKIIYQKDV